MSKVKKKIFIFLFLLFTFSYTCGFAFNLPNIIYYDEIIDVGVSDFDFNFETLAIKVYNDYETYLEQSYDVSETNHIPLIFDSRISSDSKITYIFFNNTDVVLEKTFDLNFSEFTLVPAFKLCKETKCNDSEYFFWKGESIFLTLNEDVDTSNFFFDISILSNNNEVVFFDRNISFPYEIQEYLVSDYEDYTIVIDYSYFNHFFQEELNFTSFNYFEKEYFEYLEEVVFDNVLLEAEIFDNEQIEEKDTDNNTVFQEIPEQTKIKNNSKFTSNKSIYLYVSIIIIFIVILISFFLKKKDRRISRKKN